MCSGRPRERVPACRRRAEVACWSGGARLSSSDGSASLLRSGTYSERRQRAVSSTAAAWLRRTKHPPRAGRPRIIAAADGLAVDEHAVRAAIPVPARPPGAGGDQSHDRRLAVRPGHERRRNAVPSPSKVAARLRQVCGGQLWRPLPRRASVHRRRAAPAGRARRRHRAARAVAGCASAPRGGAAAGSRRRLEHRRLGFLRLLGGERGDRVRRAAPGSRSAIEAASAHSLTSVAVKSWSVRRARARARRRVAWAIARLGRRGPAMLLAREAHAPFPVAKHARIALVRLEHGAGAVEEPVVTGQAARIGEGR